MKTGHLRHCPWAKCMWLSGVLGALLGWAGGIHEARAQAVPVQVVMQPDGSWQLLRGGEPFFVKGAGGDGSLQALSYAGALLISRLSWRS